MSTPRPTSIVFRPNTASTAATTFVVGFFSGIACTSAAVLVFGFALLWFTSSIYGDGGTIVAEQQEHPQRPIKEMRNDVNAFLKNSKSKDDPELKMGAILDLCHIYREIVTDPRLVDNRSLASLRANTATRLKKYIKEVRVETARKQRKEAKEMAANNKRLLAGETIDNSLKNRKPDEHLFSKTTSAEAAASANGESTVGQNIDDAMVASMQDLGAALGGPTQTFGYLSGNFAPPPWDHGEELVSLIESVISPDSWERNGGNATIQYYRPLRILVVGATSKTHDDLTNVLRNLRRLSR